MHITRKSLKDTIEFAYLFADERPRVFFPLSNSVAVHVREYREQIKLSTRLVIIQIPGTGLPEMEIMFRYLYGF